MKDSGSSQTIASPLRTIGSKRNEAAPLRNIVGTIYIAVPFVKPTESRDPPSLSERVFENPTEMGQALDSIQLEFRDGS